MSPSSMASGTSSTFTAPIRCVVVTQGKGLVVTEDERVELNEGDVVISPAGEKALAWCRAPDTNMTHITITGGGGQTDQLEP